MILYLIKNKRNGDMHVVKFENDIFYFFGHDTTWTRSQLEEYYTIIKRTKLEKLF